MISIRSVYKKYDDKTIIQDLNLDIEKGQFFTLLGPSGCGKTTLLRMIAGFVYVSQGEIYINENLINNVPVHKRNIGFVFQNYALFPHLTVAQNIGYGLKEQKLSKDIIKRKVDSILEITKLTHVADQYPESLSGGQQQRVSLARAVVTSPQVLLMDEPLSNLDAKLRVEMREFIRDIHDDLGITTIYVTHDQEEALSMSDKIAIMQNGSIQQIDTPQNIYKKPANAFVATFVGKSNILSKQEFVQLFGDIDDSSIVSIRPEDFIESETGAKFKIKSKTFLGNHSLLKLTKDDITLLYQIDQNNYNVGDMLNITPIMNKINIFKDSEIQND